MDWTVGSDQLLTEIQHPLFRQMLKTLNPDAPDISDSMLKRDLYAEVERIQESVIHMLSVS